MNPIFALLKVTFNLLLFHFESKIRQKPKSLLNYLQPQNASDSFTNLLKFRALDWKIKMYYPFTDSSNNEKKSS
jgi:hypothetical protein